MRFGWMNKFLQNIVQCVPVEKVSNPANQIVHIEKNSKDENPTKKL
jgi:hypothetical protein